MTRIAKALNRWPAKGLVVGIILLIGFSKTALCESAETAASVAPWEMVKEEDGIKVFLRDVKGSEYKEYRGEAIINAELNSLLALMDDTQACVDWMLNCKNPKLIQKVSMLERYIYQVNNLPWPVSDRDMVVHIRISQETSTRAVTVELQGVKVEDLASDIQQHIPSNDNYVRVEKLKGFWKFIPLDENRTKAIYQMHVELGGMLTPAIVNIGIIKSPIKTIQKMRNVVQLDKYRCFKPF